MKLNNRLFQLISLGALGVIGGVVAKNTSEQLSTLSKYNKEMLGYLGMALFVVGWATVGYAITQKENNPNDPLVWGAVLGIVASVLLMKAQGKQMTMLLPVIFALELVGTRMGCGWSKQFIIGNVDGSSRTRIHDGRITISTEKLCS